LKCANKMAEVHGNRTHLIQFIYQYYRIVIEGVGVKVKEKLKDL